MKHTLNYILFILLLSVCSTTNGQTGSDSYRIISSNVGVAGSSNKVVTSSGNYFVSQSVGQSSTIGTHSKKGFVLSQGYQQSFNTIKVSGVSESNSLKAVIHPNPFGASISMSFSTVPEKEVLVYVFDVSGKRVYSKRFSPSNTLELDLKYLSSGVYMLKANSGTRLLNAKLIKK